MLDLNTITRGLLAAPLLALALALVAAPDAAAVPLMPEGDEPIGPAAGAGGAASTAQAAPSGIDFSDIALAAASGLAALAIVAVVVVIAIDRSRAARSRDRAQPLPRF
jgi:hypothetical protein